MIAGRKAFLKDMLTRARGCLIATAAMLEKPEPSWCVHSVWIVWAAKDEKDEATETGRARS